MSLMRRRRQFLKRSLTLAASSLLPVPVVTRVFAQYAPAPGVAGPVASLPAQARVGWPLMRPDLSHSLAVRCLAKPVLARRLIDDMETDGGWTATPPVTLGYTGERAKSGTRSLRFSTLVRNEEYIRSARAANGSFNGREVAFVGEEHPAYATLKFPAPQDWSEYNRLSLWCYLHPTDNPINGVQLQFVCEGASAGPSDPIALHCVAELKPGEWNHLTWEISEYQRDRVTSFIIFKTLSGVPMRGLDPRLTYDFDQLALERVNVEPVSGWDVTPGKIAYSHFGYQPAAGKLAISGDSAVQSFTLVDADSGAVVATLPVKPLINRRGRFLILDFSEFATPGNYRLKCGESSSEAFPIGEDVFGLLIDSTLNTFNGFRCGCAIPGVHDACHTDVFVEYKGERRVAGGGWHDASNMDEFADSTHLSIYTLLRLYEQLAAIPDEARRASRTLDEARWGLEWALRMRFAPGLRCTHTDAWYYTDGIVGNDDDVILDNVVHDLRENVFAVIALAAAARVLESVDPALAAQAFTAAQEDYADILGELTQPLSKLASTGDAGRGTWRDLTAYMALTAVELYRLTQKTAYRTDAVRFGGWLLDLQEQQFVGGSPVTGYFYADPQRTQIQRELYGSCDDSGMLALQALCDAFPQDPAWIDWYAGLLIYSEYYCRQGTAASAPYDIIPAVVWRREDLDTDVRPHPWEWKLSTSPSALFPTIPTEQLTRAQTLEMYEAGTRLTENMRLRVFPIWFDHMMHGSTTGHLCRTAALASAAQVRGSLDLSDLAARQMQWIVGGNPFSRSLIFGIGYDYWHNYTNSLINFVGGLGLGMNSYRDDAPAWPNSAAFPSKEQWSYSTSRLAINLAYQGLPARLEGRATAVATLKEERTGRLLSIPPGRFRRVLPAGRYSVSCGGFEWKLDLLSGCRYQRTFDPRHVIDLLPTATGDGSDAVQLRLRLRGVGEHTLALRLFNCKAVGLEKRVTLRKGVEAMIDWSLHVTDRLKPWIAVVVPDSNPELRREAFGRLGPYAELA